MYIFYEHHRTAEGKIALTEIKLSSSANSWYINHKHITEETVFKLCVTILKTPPSLYRDYEPKIALWTYLENWGERVLKQAVETCRGVKPLILIEASHLKELASERYFDLTKSPKAIPRPEEFFYQQAAAPTALSKEAITEKLSIILGTAKETLERSANGELKKLYRIAALRLHPDRNGGDGSKMSELNMLWRMYNG